MNKIKTIAWSFLRAIFQLISYVFFGLTPFVPAAICYLFDHKKGFVFLLRVDYAVCVISHGVERTISGLTGERATLYKRYRVQEIAIDLMAYPIEKKWHHCKRVNTVEQYKFIKTGKYVKIK